MLNAALDMLLAFFLDRPFSAILCAISLLITIITLLVIMSQIGYQTFDVCFRRRVCGMLMVVSKQVVPAHVEYQMIGCGDRGIEYEGIRVPISWYLVVQKGRMIGRAKVPKWRHDQTQLGQEIEARYFSGRFSREIFVEETL
jgi:hypothetical protein